MAKPITLFSVEISVLLNPLFENAFLLTINGLEEDGAATTTDTTKLYTTPEDMLYVADELYPLEAAGPDGRSCRPRRFLNNQRLGPLVKGANRPHRKKM